MAFLLEPFSIELGEPLLAALSTYLDLLLRWNARTNLTAIRDPEEIVVRHFGESLFLASFIPADTSKWLDFGSGAGFPGVPAKLLRPDLCLTLAESQNKKSAFLRELLRELALVCEVWPARIEAMPEARTFEGVVMRAVDDPKLALRVACLRLAPGGTILLLGTRETPPGGSLSWQAEPVPGSRSKVLYRARSLIVPRGTI